MKKKIIKLDRKLILNKEIIGTLTEEQRAAIHGGAPLTVQAWDARCQTYLETCETIPYRGHICNMLC